LLRLELTQRTLQDFGLLVDGAVFSPEWVVDFQRDLQARLESRFLGTDGPQYLSRVVDSYAHKIEVYDPAYGSFPLDSGQAGGEKYGGARYHHVSVDLQLHVEEVEDEHDDQDEGVPWRTAERHNAASWTTKEKQAALAAGKVVLRCGEILTGGVTIQHSDFATRGQAPGDAYEPFGTVRFADHDWPVPAQQKIFLSYLYGYVGLGAEFDNCSMLYRKKLLPAALQTPAGRRASADVETGENPLPVLRLYTDMCADLFHTGHVNYLRQCRQVAEKVHLIVGIHSDATIESYKRASVCTMEERIAVMEACQFVDEVYADAPLQVTDAFLDDNEIDFVVHGTETPEAERQAMYDVPIGRGMYTEVPRTGGISTTDLINRIASRLAVKKENEDAIPSERQTVLAVVKQIEALQKELAGLQADRMEEIRKGEDA
jgi:cytidyltransferase-like protein